MSQYDLKTLVDKPIENLTLEEGIFIKEYFDRLKKEFSAERYIELFKHNEYFPGYWLFEICDEIRNRASEEDKFIHDSYEQFIKDEQFMVMRDWYLKFMPEEAKNNIDLKFLNFIKKINRLTKEDLLEDLSYDSRDVSSILFGGFPEDVSFEEFIALFYDVSFKPELHESMKQNSNIINQHVSLTETVGVSNTEETPKRRRPML